MRLAEVQRRFVCDLRFGRSTNLYIVAIGVVFRGISAVRIVLFCSFDRACRLPPHYTNGTQWIVNGSLPLF